MTALNASCNKTTKQYNTCEQKQGVMQCKVVGMAFMNAWFGIYERLGWHL